MQPAGLPWPAPAFSSRSGPSSRVALRVAAGKIDAVTGKEWSPGLHKRPQDYLLIPEQPWLDGYCVEEGVIRQFVAMPLGAGYTAEEQLTGEAEHGGLQRVQTGVGAHQLVVVLFGRTVRTQQPQLGGRFGVVGFIKVGFDRGRNCLHPVR